MFIIHNQQWFLIQDSLINIPKNSNKIFFFLFLSLSQFGLQFQNFPDFWCSRVYLLLPLLFYLSYGFSTQFCFRKLTLDSKLRLPSWMDGEAIGAILAFSLSLSAFFICCIYNWSLKTSFGVNGSSLNFLSLNLKTMEFSLP